MTTDGEPYGANGGLAHDFASLATHYARMIAHGEMSSAILETADLGADDDAKLYLARARVLGAMRALADNDLGRDVGEAIKRGASFDDIAEALMEPRKDVEKRWGYLIRKPGV